MPIIDASQIHFRLQISCSISKRERPEASEGLKCTKSAEYIAMQCVLDFQMCYFVSIRFYQKMHSWFGYLPHSMVLCLQKHVHWLG